ncbi:MAG: hypothetical protein ABIA56_01190, partial [Actinomycetota bacterium]
MALVVEGVTNLLKAAEIVEIKEKWEVGLRRRRDIIHVDMDAFFAQVEQRDNPEYKKKAVIVGGPLFRGVISSASYEARVYGLYAGMPL